MKVVHGHITFVILFVIMIVEAGVMLHVTLGLSEGAVGSCFQPSSCVVFI